MVHQDMTASIGGTVTIDVRHEVFVDLKIYTLPLHFTPSAKNRNI